jgi:hypothetical protein
VNFFQYKGRTEKVEEWGLYELVAINNYINKTASMVGTNN